MNADQFTALIAEAERLSTSLRMDRFEARAQTVDRLRDALIDLGSLPGARRAVASPVGGTGA